MTDIDNPDLSPVTPQAEQTPASDPAVGAEGQNETFSREYVEELRRESAKHRTNSKRADDLATALVRSYAETTGLLHDASDLAMTEDLLVEGVPDRLKVKEAVEVLIASKPHLAKIRPVGDIGQGALESSTVSGVAAFGSMLRDAAR